MSARSDATRWGSVAKFFHWTIALFVIGLLVGGLTMVDMKVSPDKFKLYALHKSFGITVLALMLLRFAWRGIDPRPQDVAGMAPIVAFAAHAVHRLLYVALLAMSASTARSRTAASGSPPRSTWPTATCRPSSRRTRTSSTSPTRSTSFWPGPSSRCCWPMWPAR